MLARYMLLLFNCWFLIMYLHFFRIIIVLGIGALMFTLEVGWRKDTQIQNVTWFLILFSQHPSTQPQEGDFTAFYNWPRLACVFNDLAYEMWLKRLSSWVQFNKNIPFHHGLAFNTFVLLSQLHNSSIGIY